jgi:hypothetical protein
VLDRDRDRARAARARWFAGDSQRWLDGQRGERDRRMDAAARPLSAACVTMFVFSRFVNPWVRAAISRSWSRRVRARRLLRFLVGRPVVDDRAGRRRPWLLRAMHFDPRGLVRRHLRAAQRARGRRA